MLSNRQNVSQIVLTSPEKNAEYTHLHDSAGVSLCAMGPRTVESTSLIDARQANSVCACDAGLEHLPFHSAQQSHKVAHFCCAHAPLNAGGLRGKTQPNRY